MLTKAECRCRQCVRDRDERDDVTGLLMTAMRMTLCPVCGNKRCPHASDHKFRCTGSNKRGQAGSVYV